MLNSSHAGSARGRRHQLMRLRLLLRLLLPLLLLLIAASGCGRCQALSSAFSVAQLRRGGSQKLCGTVLNEAMDSVCVNGYNTIPKKRFAAGRPGYTLSPLLSGLYGGELLVKTRRLRRQGGGINDECCRKPCDYYELLAYCRQ